MPHTKRQKTKSSSRTIVLGTVGYQKISAVEGIHLSAASKLMFAKFKQQKLTSTQCRRAIAAKHAKKA